MENQQKVRQQDPWTIPVMKAVWGRKYFSMDDILRVLDIPASGVNELVKKRIGDIIKKDPRYCATGWENLFPGK